MDQLTMRFEKFLCRGCNKVGSHDARMVCDKCHGDFIALIELYNLIVRERPDLRHLTMPELFARMWAAVKTKPKKR